ncbi:MAG TPA: hypothetical protein VD846_01975 [Allosphingosinicella sp.]|nr:hypothetical protein [Allosphingosinicella sp.]
MIAVLLLLAAQPAQAAGLRLPTEQEIVVTGRRMNRVQIAAGPSRDKSDGGAQ